MKAHVPDFTQHDILLENTLYCCRTGKLKSIKKIDKQLLVDEQLTASVTGY